MGDKSRAVRTRTPAQASGTVAVAGAGTATTPSLSRKPSSAASSTASKQQKSILGFFTKTPRDKEKAEDKDTDAETTTASAMPSSSPCLEETKSNSLQLNKRPSKNITPVPSSDALEPSSSQENIGSATTVKVLEDDEHPLPSPVTPAEVVIKQAVPPSEIAAVMGSSPSRKVGSILPHPSNLMPPLLTSLPLSV